MTVKNEPITRIKPQKKLELTKEQKAKYKECSTAISFLAAFASEIEDKTINKNIVSDLAMGELHVLETISKNSESTISEIAKLEHVTLGAFITCLNRLVAKGYVDRTKDEMDHRINYLTVTQKAKTVLKEHDAFYNNVLDLLLEHTTVDKAHEVLTNLTKYMDAYYDPSTLQPPKKKTKLIMAKKAQEAAKKAPENAKTTSKKTTNIVTKSVTKGAVKKTTTKKKATPKKTTKKTTTKKVTKSAKKA